MSPAPRIVHRLDALARCSDDLPRLTRLAWSPAMRRAHELVDGWMREAGLATRMDAVGNLVGRREGSRPGAKTLLIGSHLDSVRDAGRFDGPLGVLLGLAVAEERRSLPFALEVVGFIDEEGVRFPGTYLGSRVLAGTLGPAELAMRDAEGRTMAEVIQAFGGDPALLGQERRDPPSLLGYVEAHIEQGPVLEALGQPVGVVSAIAGQTRARVRIEGQAGHAGTVPMALRRDALCAAAEFVLAVENRGKTTGGFVATVGLLHAFPGAGNVIPGAVELSVDIRHQDDALRQAAVLALQGELDRLVAVRGLRSTWTTGHEAAAVHCDPQLTGRLRLAAGDAAPTLPSGAGHDAAALAALCPVAMLFIRCRGGVSHHPDEFASAEDIAAAHEVLLRFLDCLALDHA